LLKVLKYGDLPGDEFEYLEGREIMARNQVRQVVGAGANGYMVEILWHRRETRRLMEKTNLDL